MKLKIKKGLDVPLAGKPEGELQTLPKPSQIALTFDAFEEIRFKLLVKPGEMVKIGQPLAESKTIPGVLFVSPAGGVLKEVRRGLKRRLMALVIDVAEKEEEKAGRKVDLSVITREKLIERLMKGGVFPYLRMRPFDLLANPKHLPRDIFVRAVETAPFVPPAEMQVAGFESYFQTGLDTLAKLTDGKVHLIHKAGSTCDAFVNAQNAQAHSIEGPHPAANPSVHIAQIAPIMHGEDHLWTTSVLGVIAIGKLVQTGKTHTDRVIAIGGNGVLPGRTGFFKGRAGFPVHALMVNRITDQLLRFISGDPLMGHKVEANDFLGFYDTTLSVIPENVRREPFHFFRPGLKKYTASRAYLTGHFKPPQEGYAFTTNQHGEDRPFIDARVYTKVMPLRIPTMHLVKAMMAEDFEVAEELGIFEVASEDFALPTFVCPSKVEMVEIVKRGLHAYAEELGH